MLTSERLITIRSMADLQSKRHAEFGGDETSYQVAINPSELRALLDDAELGWAVRASGVTLADADRFARSLRSAIGSLQLSYESGGYSLRAELALIDAYAAALREEASDA